MKKKIKIKNIIFLFLLLTIFYLLPKNIISVYSFISRQKILKNCYPPEKSMDITQKTENSVLGYELKPNLEVELDGVLCKIKFHKTKINSKGFRDYEFDLEKPNNTVRIIAIGDSFTFGFLVEMEDSWPKVLERILNEKNKNKSIKYEVLNFGVPGYGLEQYVENIKERAIRYNPDIIIIGLIADDFLTNKKREILVKSISEGVKIAKEKINKTDLSELEENILIYDVVTFTYFNYLKISKDNYLLEIKKQFEKINNLTKNKNIKIIIAVIGSQPTEFIKTIKEESENNNFCFVNAIPDKNILDKNINTFAPLDNHPNENGHKFIARKVYKKIIECSK